MTALPGPEVSKENKWILCVIPDSQKIFYLARIIPLSDLRMNSRI
jgi:hypothetical protein